MKPSEIRVHDQIVINGSIAGQVAFSTVTGEYSNEYPEVEWSETGANGIMIVQENGARYFHTVEDDDQFEKTD